MPIFTTSENDSSISHKFFKQPVVIINELAGSTSDTTPELKAIFQSFDCPEPLVYLVDPSEITATFEKVETDGTDLLVIYAGDGTCKAGAITASKCKIPLVALPGGTMNMLANALYGTDYWHTALELALSQKKPRWQAAGNANGKVFFCGAILGDPITMSEARESLRDGDVIEALKQLP